MEKQVSKYLKLIDNKGWDKNKVSIFQFGYQNIEVMYYEGVAYLIINNKLENLNQYLQRNKDFYHDFLLQFQS